jgi:hypothetical protein
MYHATWPTHRRSDGTRFMSTIPRHQLSHINKWAFTRSTTDCQRWLSRWCIPRHRDSASRWRRTASRAQALLYQAVVSSFITWGWFSLDQQMSRLSPEFVFDQYVEWHRGTIAKQERTCLQCPYTIRILAFLDDPVDIQAELNFATDREVDGILSITDWAQLLFRPPFVMAQL